MQIAARTEISTRNFSPTIHFESHLNDVCSLISMYFYTFGIIALLGLFFSFSFRYSMLLTEVYEYWIIYLIFSRLIFYRDNIAISS